jgi:predicted dehydrogenase
MRRPKQSRRRVFLAAAAGLVAARKAPGGEKVREVKVGVCGCGSVSGSYLPVMAASPYVEIVSACDIIRERAEERARRFNIPNVFADIDSMLASPPFEFMARTLAGGKLGKVTAAHAHYGHEGRLWSAFKWPLFA